MFIRMNDLVVHNVVVIPVIIRHAVFATSNSIRGLEQAFPGWEIDVQHQAGDPGGRSDSEA